MWFVLPVRSAAWQAWCASLRTVAPMALRHRLSIGFAFVATLQRARARDPAELFRRQCRIARRLCPPNSARIVGRILSNRSIRISLKYNELRGSNLVTGVTDWIFCQYADQTVGKRGGARKFLAPPSGFGFAAPAALCDQPNRLVVQATGLHPNLRACGPSGQLIDVRAGVRAARAAPLELTAG